MTPETIYIGIGISVAVLALFGNLYSIIESNIGMMCKIDYRKIIYFVGLFLMISIILIVGVLMFCYQ